MRIAVAGNQWITRYLLDELGSHGLAPALIVNMPPERSSAISGYIDLAETAARVGAEIYRPDKYSLKSQVDQAALQERGIDLLLVFGWQRLIPGWFINSCRIGAYGVHGGPELPPRCRGRAVFNWAILLGYDRFHMYAFELNEGVDEGNIVGLETFDILPEDDVLTLYHKNCVVSTRLFLDIASAAAKGEVRGTPQANEGATYLPKRAPENGGISWAQPAKRVVDLVRALAPPYPGAFTDCGDARIFIQRAQLFDTRIAYEGEPGTIVDVFPNGHFVVIASDASVYVREWTVASNFRPQKNARFDLISGVSLPDPVM